MRDIKHTWDVSVTEATNIQKELRTRIKLQKLRKKVQTIAAADISFMRYSDVLYACVLVLSFPDLVEIERICIQGKATFPYIPGYLSFREIPLLLRAFNKLKTKPDVIMADGQGIAHPRRLGIAAHLGLHLQTPSFGCAKSKLYGEGDDPAELRGSISHLIDPKDGDTIGAFVRTKDGIQPIIVSPGHLITLQESIDLALETTRGYRIPEPTRRAHNAVNEFRRKSSA
jgi:deoxyribonuclease V